MQNSYWEEQEMKNPILEFHNQQIEAMGLPIWIKDIKCPFCKRNLPPRGVYNIQLCLNTRNFGEIAIVVFCDECKKMDTLYFRTNMTCLKEFAFALAGEYEMPKETVVEESMYKMGYNNILEKMVSQKNEENNDII